VPGLYLVTWGIVVDATASGVGGMHFDFIISGRHLNGSTETIGHIPFRLPAAGAGSVFRVGTAVAVPVRLSNFDDPPLYPVEVDVVAQWIQGITALIMQGTNASFLGFSRLTPF